MLINKLRKRWMRFILLGLFSLIGFIFVYFYINWQVADQNLAAQSIQSPFQTFFFSPKAVELLVKQKMIVNTLKRNGKISSKEIQQILSQNVLNAQVLQSSEGYTFITDQNGFAQEYIPKGKYILDTPTLAKVAVRIPAYIDLTKAADTHIIAISVSEGESQVIKTDPQIASKAVKGSQKTSTNLKLVVFRDDNKNGKWEGNEQNLPWAGVKLMLKKPLQQELISLNPGWNLITLPTIPIKPTNAAQLLAAITLQGGQADIVSTLIGEEWNSYVSRGNKVYAGSNFLIEPGKAYFVRVLKSSNFFVTGQNLVVPLSLNLQEGWNTVGMPYLSSVYHADSFLKNLNAPPGATSLIARFETGLWDTFVEKQQKTYGNNFLIENDRGYVIRSEKGVKISP